MSDPFDPFGPLPSRDTLTSAFLNCLHPSTGIRPTTFMNLVRMFSEMNARDKISVSLIGGYQGAPDLISAAENNAMATLGMTFMGVLPSHDMLKRTSQLQGLEFGQEEKEIFLSRTINFIRTAVMAIYPYIEGGTLDHKTAINENVAHALGCKLYSDLYANDNISVVRAHEGKKSYVDLCSDLEMTFKRFEMFCNKPFLAQFGIFLTDSSMETAQINSVSFLELAKGVLTAADMNPAAYGITKNSDESRLLEALRYGINDLKAVFNELQLHNGIGSESVTHRASARVKHHPTS